MTENKTAPAFLAIVLAFIFMTAGCSHKGKHGKNHPEQPTGITREEALRDNLEDMYRRIYGEDAVYFKDDLLRVDLARQYKDLANLKLSQAESRYKAILKQAKLLEKAGNTTAAVRKFRRCTFIENNIFHKPGLGAIALERIYRQALDRAGKLEKSGDLKAALRHAEVAVACNPSAPVGLMAAGGLFAKTGEEGLAIPYLRSALAHRKTDSLLKYRLKNLYVLEGRPQGAIPLITREISSHTRLGTHWADQAEAYSVLYTLHPRRTDLKEKVEIALTRALAQRGITKEARIELQLSRALFNRNFEEALKLLRNLEELTTDPALKTRIIYNRGLLHLTKNRREQGARFLRDTVRRMFDHLNITQGEDYMGLMAAWSLDLMGVKTLSAARGKEIFTRLKNPDHSYRQEYGYLNRYLSAREKGKYLQAARALEDLTKKRHLESVGDFVQDVLQVPAEKGLVYVSMGEMYDRARKREKARECFLEVEDNPFFGYKAREHLKQLDHPGKF